MNALTIGIRGAGLSGLSVARELITLEPNAKITLFDTRPRLPHLSRTFCFFRTQECPSFPVRSFSWNSVMFRGASFERRLDVSTSPYTMIRGEDFFSSTLSYLESRGVEFHWECSSVEVSKNTIYADGQTSTFDAVVDAAFEATTARAMMWQSFAGVWASSQQPIFDPGTALLMDIHESSAEAPVSFLYILPTSERTALVEHTTFSPSPMAKGYHLDRCFEWLSRNHRDEFQLGATEYGAIPMGLRSTPSPAIYAVGSTAGAVRPATGYAFVRAHEQARQVAGQILSQGCQSNTPYPRWLTCADSLFLTALRNAPERGREIMERLLSQARGDALVAFLSGDVTVRDALSVWLSVPKCTMLRSLLRV